MTRDDFRALMDADHAATTAYRSGESSTAHEWAALVATTFGTVVKHLDDPDATVRQLARLAADCESAAIDVANGGTS